MKKQSLWNRALSFYWHQRAKYGLRQLERELDRHAAGILSNEEQRAERESWIKQDYGR